MLPARAAESPARIRESSNFQKSTSEEKLLAGQIRVIDRARNLEDMRMRIDRDDAITCRRHVVRTTRFRRPRKNASNAGNKNTAPSMLTKNMNESSRPMSA